MLRRFDPHPISAGLDEAYVDVTSFAAEQGLTGPQVAERIRAEVAEATGGLTCSAGVAPNRRLAKVTRAGGEGGGGRVDRVGLISPLSMRVYRRIFHRQRFQQDPHAHGRSAPLADFVPASFPPPPPPPPPRLCRYRATSTSPTASFVCPPTRRPCTTSSRRCQFERYETCMRWIGVARGGPRGIARF